MQDELVVTPKVPQPDGQNCKKDEYAIFIFHGDVYLNNPKPSNLLGRGQKNTRSSAYELKLKRSEKV